jgi:hypothetical protein
LHDSQRGSRKRAISLLPNVCGCSIVPPKAPNVIKNFEGVLH